MALMPCQLIYQKRKEYRRRARENIPLSSFAELGPDFIVAFSLEVMGSP